jgi:hypothetical protein
MAKEHKDKSKGRKTASITPKRGRARDRGETRPFTVELTPPLDDALEARAAKDMRTKKAVLVLALQEYLQRLGDWPPHPPASAK